MQSPCSSSVSGIPSTSTTPTKTDCAKNGVRALLNTLYPCDSGLASCGPNVSGNDVANPVDRVGVLTFPALNNPAAKNVDELDCTKNLGSSDVGYSNSNGYLTVPLSSDYRTSDSASSLNGSSNIVKSVWWSQCSGGVYPGASVRYGLEDPGGAGTFYAGAINAAQSVLAADSRTAQKVIILLSDGDANTGGSSPCHQGITASQNAQAAGTWVFAIAYNAPTSSSGSCTGDSPAISALCAMYAIASPSSACSGSPASNPSLRFYNQPTDGDLSAIFQQIGVSLTSTRLVSDNAT